MKIKAKQVFFVGAFIVLTLIGYIIMPKNEVVIDLSEHNIGESGEKKKEDLLFVHIEGAIKEPGVKQVPKGTRIFEIIAIAGGELKDADVSKINLASIVKDEQKIYIPFKIIETNENNTKNTSIKSDIVNINSATADELQKLEGIGPAMANKIIQYREEVGYFSSIEDIQNVTGIGESKYSKIKEKITI
mgnify:CR=1 FL=1